MSQNKKTATNRGEHDAASNPLNPFLADALANLSLASETDSDDEGQAEATLTAADQEALDSLGTPEDLVQRIMAASCETTPTEGQAERATWVDTHAKIATLPDTPPAAKPATPTFAVLQRQHRECIDKPQVGWSTEYLKRERIGRGGQGNVFRIECLDDFSGSRALKVLSPGPYGAVDPYENDMERMRRVASVIHRIQHYNLVVVDRFEKFDGIYAMVMRLIDGFNLQQLLHHDNLAKLFRSVNSDRLSKLREVVYTVPADGENRTRTWGLKPGMAVRVIDKCLHGLGAMHDNGVVHGDIKPANMMLDCDGGIRIVDISSAFELTSPPRDSAWTPRYAPPEVLTGRKWSPQSDLASLGYVLFEMLSGQPEALGPGVNSESTRTADDRDFSELKKAKKTLPHRLNELLPKHAQRSKLLVELCRRMIDPDPKKRFQSARDALNNGEAGTFPFRKQLINANLSAEWDREIRCWVRDMKEAVAQQD